MVKKRISIIAENLFLMFLLIGILISCNFEDDIVYNCKYCKDTGICSTCGGTGVNPKSNLAKCYQCNPWGSGKCGYCGGSELLE